MNIKYKIEFFTYWHCGSGLAAGADVDELVVKDENGLPYVPGKTLKGLIRGAAETIKNFDAKYSTMDIEKIFGYRQNKIDKKTVAGQLQGKVFFSNAILAEGEQCVITDELKRFLYHSVSSTAIGDDGIAKDFSLRKIEMVVPCTLHAEIMDLPDGAEDLILDSLNYIKRLGLGRNRGYGRCKISKE